jgi:glycosyltransferase involved in cell wall biosynthesis
MLHGVEVTVVVPAYQEAPRIARVLRAMPPEVDRVIVVDDASTDGTAEVALAVGDARVAVVKHATNRGVGAAIVTGYARACEARGGARDALVVMAGDGQMDPADLPALVLPIARGDADYVKGDRFLAPEVSRVMPRARFVGGKVLSRFTAWAIGVPVSDSQCGYTALARAACERLDLDDVWRGYGYPNDLLAQLARRKMRIAEVRVRPVYADEVSRLRPRHVLTIVRLIARARWRRVAGDQPAAMSSTP